MSRWSLSNRLALLFAACTAVVSLFAGVLFSRGSEAHFVELDRQLLETQLIGVRRAVQDTHGHDPQVRLDDELSRQADLTLRIKDSNGTQWHGSPIPAPPELPERPGLSTLRDADNDYRVLNALLYPDRTDSPQLTLLLNITHHQHFLQRMQRLIWLTVGLSALATALLGAWAARRGLRPLRRMGAIASSVSARSLNARLPEEHMPVELAELARSINDMLGRLDDAFQRLSAFSADIAHELRTPLSNLLTHTQVTLTRERSLEDYREALHGNLEELQWMAQLVNDMLYLAKADHGLLALHREPLQLAEEVDILLDFFAPLAEDVNIRLGRDGESLIEGDRNMLRRALSNLLDNALRFTPSGGEVRVRIVDVGQGVSVCVENSGEGVPADLLPRLFDRFYRADPSRQEGSSEHAGLGLAITRSIIRAHGGDIRCESAEGWTRFVIELPKNK
ncbi:heavy metal sensor histidine kinase [Pseudomonas alvandae]|uniref:heavy metal sensor histidine kinase n=1 Tax=Pseudomonas canavaninivorans TaxID=2842348 RepID=UPI00215EB6A2|nr:heavy metal sensor histidine kinase [Pseudomonas canavaninivorans]UVM74349.1 heavy metal sensor histidine kinase [Pseudomonas canavaninivorans]